MISSPSGVTTNDSGGPVGYKQVAISYYHAFKGTTGDCLWQMDFPEKTASQTGDHCAESLLVFCSLDRLFKSGNVQYSCI